MATMVAFWRLADKRSAAEIAPPDDGPAKMPSTRASALMVPSASRWLMSMVSSTLSSCKMFCYSTVLPSILTRLAVSTAQPRLFEAPTKVEHAMQVKIVS